MLVHGPEIRLLERHDKMDKMIKIIVLMSTRPAALYIAGCISSVVIYLTQVELQMVLISTVSTFFLSSIVVLLMPRSRTHRLC